MSAEPQNSDWLLQLLVRLANEGKLTIPVTLTVKGAVIVGEVVDGKSYFDGLAEDFTGRMAPLFDEAAKDAVKKELVSTGAQVYEENGGDKQAYYVHLKNAKIYSGADTFGAGSQSLYWRGRLDAIDGFTLGRADVA